MELVSTKRMKNYIGKAIIVAATLFLVCCKQSLNTKESSVKHVPSGELFPKGEKAATENFTGVVWVNRLEKQDNSGSYSIGNVVFEPGARTNWHLHPGGQTLIVTDGEGFYQEKGKSARSIRRGDIVLIPANATHWHGASKDNSLTHIALTNLKDGSVKWLGPVTEEEYILYAK